MTASMRNEVPEMSLAVSEERIFHHPTKRHVEIPEMDLLTFLFDSHHSAAGDDTVLHVDAAKPSNQLSKAALCDLFLRIAYALKSRYGIGSAGAGKDVVTVITHGQILVAALFYGVLCAGGVYSAVSPSSTCDDLVRQVKLAESRVLVCGQEHAAIASRAAAKCGLPLSNVLLLDSAQGRWRLESLDGMVDAVPDPQRRCHWNRLYDPVTLRSSLAMILWSSGTTGTPKAVMLSHTNLVAQAYLPAMHQTADGESAGSEYSTVAHLPVSHIAGVFSYLVRAMYFGGTVYWIRKYDWDEMLSACQKYRITNLFTVPNIWLRISKSREVHDHFRYLTAATSGAAAMGGSLQRATNKRLGDGRSVFVGQTWGLSETTGAVTWPLEDAPDDTGSIGSILPGVELRLVDEHDQDVPDGAEGEILVRSVLVTNGYYKNARATQESFLGDWLRSGDVGVLREGKFYVVDRKKEIFKYKGIQIAPAELENILFSHPAIREAAVVGVPSPDDPGSEYPRAYVVATGPDKVSEEQIKEFVRLQVAPHKQLRGGVVFVDAIPKNAAGKVLRRVLRDGAKHELLRARL